MLISNFARAWATAAPPPRPVNRLCSAGKQQVYRLRSNSRFLLSAGAFPRPEWRSIW